MSRKAFRYDPLVESDSIRLLRLEPAITREAHLRGPLIHTTIAECSYNLFRPFTALSYCWGGSDKTCEIHLDGFYTVATTPALDAALRDMRSETVHGDVWADALCINQADDQERARQVSVMHRIYRAATHTVIHLGLPDPEVHDFFARCKPNSPFAAIQEP
ncbi:hypothetical protein OQA88_5188 [Cercophora sp. LCS_1]